MPPRVGRCQICKLKDSKYTCPSCLITYCSVSCFKEHKISCSSVGSVSRIPESQPSITLEAPSPPQQQSEEGLPDPKPLKLLTSLKWPYIPEESSYPDPLKRDDPKPLQLRHYEAIASSPEIRSVLASNSTLPDLLRRLDRLRGREREEALESLLGVMDDRPMQHGNSRRVLLPTNRESEEDARALKQLAEAVEGIVRGGESDTLGLDWME